MSMTLSEADVDELLNDGGLTIGKNIRWKMRKGQLFYEFRVPVLNQFRGEVLNLELVGTKNAQLHRYSFVLMLDNRRIRGLCPFGTHRNRHTKRGPVASPHKHKWTDHCQDSFVYSPNDISDVNDIPTTLVEFLKECGINLTVSFEPPPPTQPEIPL